MNPHATPETLALLVEGRLQDPEREIWIAHLARCRRCHGAYSQAVEFQIRYQAREFEGALPREYLQAASFGRSRTRPTPMRSWRTAPIWAAAALLVFVLASLWMLQRSQPEPFAVHPELAKAVGRVSAQGMVLPGGEAWAGQAAPTYRAGGSFGDSLGDVVDQLFEQSLSGDATADQATWTLAGLVTRGRLGMARNYASTVRQNFPEDPRLAIFEAIIAYRLNDLEQAESILREVLAQHPDLEVARFNLGLLLSEEQRFDEARLHLRMLAADTGSEAPLSHRAQQLLDDLPSE